MTKALDIPPAAQRDPKAVQMASAWIAERGLHCSLNIGMYAGTEVDESRAWGIMLADMARHVSNALAEELGGEPAESFLARVREAMLEELADPTSMHSGSFSQEEQIKD